MRYLLILCCFLGMSLAKISVGDDAPTFFTKKLDGGNFFLSDILKKNNRPIVLSFFATWCKPCKVEIPLIDSLKRVYRGADYYLVNVSGLKQGNRVLKEDPAMVKIMIDDLKVNIPVLLDKYGVTAEKYNATILPTTTIINSTGKIVYLHSGFKLGDEKKLASILKELTIDKASK